MISERKLINLIKKNYRGYELSLRKLAENYNSKLDDFYPVIKSLENKGIVELKEIKEIGRDGPVDVFIVKFRPPKIDILGHPIIEKIIISFLLSVLAILAANYIWDKWFKK